MRKEKNNQSIDSKKDDHIAFGRTSEQAVATWLKKKDYIILKQNYRKRYGEIDIIGKKNNTIAFVEVKARKKDYFNTSEVITKSKQRKIIKTAKAFVLEENIYNLVLRFDVALVHGDDNNCTISYIENAFTEDMIS